MVTRAPDLELMIRRMTPVGAGPNERPKVEDVSRILVGAAHTRKRKHCSLVGPDGRKVPLPDPLFFVLERVAEVLARGDSVTIVPVGKELTTQQAADLLNVSRQYLVRLLDDNRIPHTKTGKHRRLKIEDVLRYKAERDRSRRLKLAEITRLGEEMESGYPELRK